MFDCIRSLDQATVASIQSLMKPMLQNKSASIHTHMRAATLKSSMFVEQKYQRIYAFDPLFMFMQCLRLR